VQKPRPEPLLRTIERLGGQSNDAVMVGDSLNDIATAQAAGIPVVAVDFGYSETPIHEFAPDRIINSFLALPDTVFDLLERDR
jgi:phosphoglycolate phosphatase